MGRSWSEAAQAALDAYPWHNAAEKARAAAEAELVCFGDEVTFDDLPLPVKRAARAAARRLPAGEAARQATWKGESWTELTETFEKNILAQALAAHKGNVAATARALKTTERIVAYKKRKYGINVLGKIG